MAPALPSLYTTSFLLAVVITLFVIATLRLLYILPNTRYQTTRSRRIPTATRVLIVLGSGGHTHEMFSLLRDLDTRKYTHRTYIISSGDAFSAERARNFEQNLETREKQRLRNKQEHNAAPRIALNERDPEQQKKVNSEERPTCTGPDHFNLAEVPRARKIHQPLYTTPISCLYTLLSTFGPILSSPPLLPGQPPQNAYESAAQDMPDLIITNGPATAVIIILASFILRFFNYRGANSRGKCKTVYVESFARVKTLSLSGKLLSRIVDRFLVQWEELEGKGGRAEFWGVLV